MKIITIVLIFGIRLKIIRREDNSIVQEGEKVSFFIIFFSIVILRIYQPKMLNKKLKHDIFFEKS